MADPADHYKVLQVDSEADPEVIQAAYRRLAQKFHPDLAPGPEAAARMVAINAAWHVLSDPGRRASFDRERAVGRREPGASGGAAPGATGGAAPGATGGSPAAGPTAPPDGAVGSSARPRSPTGAGGSVQPPRPESVSRDWTSGRSSVGGGYDPTTMRAAEGHGAAGPPPGKPSGSVLNFGRYAGWSLGEIARTDLEYLEWLDRVPIGRAHREEIDGILRSAGRRRSGRPDEGERRGLFRRR